jgi:hypothetical protein
MAFLFERAADDADPAYPHYHRDLLAIRRDGLSRPDRAWIPTRRGRRVRLHGCVNLVVTRDLGVLLAGKRRQAAPGSYRGYVEIVAAAIARVVANATDPARRPGTASSAAPARAIHPCARR